MRSSNLLYVVHRLHFPTSLCAAALALAVALVAPAPADAGQDICLYDGGEIRRISEMGDTVESLEIGDGGHVVWSGWDGADYEIYLYDGTEVVRLTDDEGQDRYPQVNAWGQVTWQGGPRLPDRIEEYDIRLFDGSTTLKLTHNALPDVRPRISDAGWVVWEVDDGNDYEIVLYDGTGKRALTSNDWADQYPEINTAGQVVWQMRDPVGGDWDIVLFDSMGKRAITHNDLRDTEPRINDAGQVVWQQGPGANPEILLYDGTQVRQLSDDEPRDRQPELNAAGWVVWQTKEHKNDDWEIVLHDGTGKRALTQNDRDDVDPRINDPGQVVWSEWDGTDWEVFLYDGVEVRQLTDDAYDNENPRINALGQVAWISSDHCQDADGDGYGYGDAGLYTCDRRAADCDDADPAVSPGALEGPEGDPTCADGIDNDCDGLTDEEDGGCFWGLACEDRDGDGFGEPASPVCPFAQRDCDDSDPGLNAGVREVCDNGRDDDCDGFTDGDDPECGADLWEFETIDPDMVGGAALSVFGEMVLDADDRLHVVYHDGEDNELRYATNATGTWVTETVQRDADVPFQRGLAVNRDGGVHFVYREWTSGLARYVTNVTGVWEIVSLEALGAPGVFWDRWVPGAMAVSDAGIVHALQWEGDRDEWEGSIVYYSGPPGELTREVVEPEAAAWASHLEIAPSGEVHVLYNSSVGDEPLFVADYVHAVHGSDGWDKSVYYQYDGGHYPTLGFAPGDLGVDRGGGAHVVGWLVGLIQRAPVFELHHTTDRWGGWRSLFGGRLEDSCYHSFCQWWPRVAVDRDGVHFVTYMEARAMGPGYEEAEVTLRLVEDPAVNREDSVVHGPTVVDGTFLPDLDIYPFPFFDPQFPESTIPLALDSRGRPHLCFQDPETGALIHATRRPPASGLIGPAEGKGLTEPPVLSWQSGDREAFGLLLFLRLAGLGYQPITFWMERDRFPIPQAWWQAMVPDEPQFWLVFAYDAETGTLEASEARWFTKQEGEQG